MRSLSSHGPVERNAYSTPWCAYYSYIITIIIIIGTRAYPLQLSRHIYISPRTNLTACHLDNEYRIIAVSIIINVHRRVVATHKTGFSLANFADPTLFYYILQFGHVVVAAMELFATQYYASCCGVVVRCRKEYIYIYKYSV